MFTDIGIRRLAYIALAGTFVAVLLTLLSPVRSFENFLSDLRVSHHPAPFAPHERIVIIAIDDASLEGIAYTSPINRGLIASVLDKLDKSDSLVIGLDILLQRPSEPAADALLAETLETSETPVILLFDPGLEARSAICAGKAIPSFSLNTLEPFRRAATLAHGVQCTNTLDEVLRTAPITSEPTSLAQAVAASAGWDGQVDTESLVIPFRTGENALWPFPTYSAAHADVLPEDWFRDKVVLVGPIAPYSGDFVTTPLRFSDKPIPAEPSDLLPQGELPGVVVHAYTIAGLLDGIRGQRITIWDQIPLAIIGALAGLLIGVARLRLWLTIAIIAGVLAIYWWLVFALFNWTGGALLLPYSGLSAALLLVAGGTFASLERDERARRRMVHESFTFFLSEDRVTEILRSPGLLSLNAEERDVSILFTDLEDFTKLVDLTPPHTLAPALNGYLDGIVDVVVRYGGTVDKIVGDAVHAMFSAPLHVPDHRLKSLHCALDLQDTAETYRKVITDEGIAFGGTRVGISSGAAMVGNFGSSKRFDYTAHGSIVNLAARLEAANKVFGTRVCLAEASRIDTDELRYREIGHVEVRGIETPIRVFEALRAGQLSEDTLRDYQKAFDSTVSDPKAARRLFEALLAEHPGDGLILYQIQQINMRLGEPH